MSEPGIVFLVGAGPGDPGLLTLRGKECLERAEVVVYDYLANPELLEYVPAAAERIYVGKEAGQHTMPQEQINAVLVARGRAGRRVVRLKGGDPFVFGRGGEEAQELRAAGIRVEIVPGVTAGLAAPAYAGIPVTHRDCNSVLTLATGHEDPAKPESALDWPALARGGGTLVFYMGVGNLPGIAQRLIAGGRAAGTPVAVVRHGTLPGQQVVEGTLATIAERAAEAKLKPPAVIVVGEVVRLREHLHWFEDAPLFGKTVMVTRSRSQASNLAAGLQRLGARVLLLPTIRIEPPEDPGPLAAAVAGLPAAVDWVVFTSTNAVDRVFAALDEQGRDARALAGCRLAAIGPGTADRLRAHGLRADLVPPRFTTAALSAALAERGETRGRRFLLPRADIAPPGLTECLRAAGAEVTEVTAYRTCPETPAADVLEALRNGEVDAVTFTSSSTVSGYLVAVRQALGAPPTGVLYASIGPETSRTAAAAGLTVGVEAAEHTVPGLIAALVGRLQGTPAP